MALELNGTTGVSLVQDGVVVAADLNSALSDTIGKVKAWVNFNGTGTVAIRASFNVSTITDNGPGDYSVNFTTAITDINYAVGVTVARSDSSPNIMGGIHSAGTAYDTTAIRVTAVIPTTAGLADAPYINVAIFR